MLPSYLVTATLRTQRLDLCCGSDTSAAGSVLSDTKRMAPPCEARYALLKARYQCRSILMALLMVVLCAPIFRLCTVQHSKIRSGAVNGGSRAGL